ncbi:MAG: hypothetical protein ACE5R4_08375 [Armatimonadota bacterium]
MRAWALVASLALTSGAASAWDMDEFMILLGWPAEVGCPDAEALARAMSQAGINTVMWDVAKLELCRKYGLRLAVYQGPVVSEELVSEEQLAKWRASPRWPKDVPPLTTDLVAQVSHDPVVWGYYVFDQPEERMFPFYAQVLEEFHRADPVHPAYISLSPRRGDLLRRYLDVVQPRILSYGHYQWWRGEQARHFPILEDYRRASLDADIPLVRWLEVNAGGAEHDDSAPPPEDNARKLRQTVYTSLAYGVKGMAWFTASKLFEHGTAELRPCGQDVAALNAELRELGPVLVRLRSLDVFHTAPVPGPGRAIPEGLGVQTDTPDLVLGVFEHRDDGASDYLLLVNKGIQEPRDVTLRFERRPSKVFRLHKADGRWALVPIQRAEGRSAVELSLRPGDGELLRVRPRIIRLRPHIAEGGPRPGDDAPLLLDDGPPLLDDGPQGEKVADNSRCHHCHLNYVQEEIAVVHAQANIGCADCHGDSDEHIADESWASGGNGTAPDIMYRLNEVNAFCLRCHTRDDMGEKQHGAFFAGTADEKYCTDCHGEHRLAVRRCKWK